MVLQPRASCAFASSARAAGAPTTLNAIARSARNTDRFPLQAHASRQRMPRQRFFQLPAVLVTESRLGQLAQCRGRHFASCTLPREANPLEVAPAAFVRRTVALDEPLAARDLDRERRTS